MYDFYTFELPAQWSMEYSRRSGDWMLHHDGRARMLGTKTDCLAYATARISAQAWAEWCAERISSEMAELEIPE